METEEEDMELEEYDHHVEASTPEEDDDDEDEEEEEDPIYEFDAPRYYDFTRPETYLQALEAERWFDSAAANPPSPFLAKLNLNKSISGEENVSPRRMDTDSGIESPVQQVGKNIVKISSSASSNTVVIRGSTLMKPTVSHLAKHRHPYEIKRLLRSRKIRMHSRTATLQYDNNAATKRQKLENGYLKKDAHLNHQAVLSHKLCKKATDNNINQLNCPRPPLKVTVPKEPQLETARRAQRRRSKTSVESSVTTKSNLLSPPKARTPFTRKTVKSIDSQDDAAENKKQVAAEGSNNSKYESPYRFKARKLEKVPKLPKEKHEMPIRLFEKMTLEPEAQNHTTPDQANKRL